MAFFKRNFNVTSDHAYMREADGEITSKTVGTSSFDLAVASANIHRLNAM